MFVSRMLTREKKIRQLFLKNVEMFVDVDKLGSENHYSLVYFI